MTRGFHQGNCVDSSAINQDNAQTERCALENGREWVQFGVSWVWQASRISRWKCPEGWAQMQSEQFTLPFFPPLQNGWDIACHFSPRTVERINEAVFTFIPHWGSVRAWQNITLSPIMLTWKQSSFDMKVTEEGECKLQGHFVEYNCTSGSQSKYCLDVGEH